MNLVERTDAAIQKYMKREREEYLEIWAELIRALIPIAAQNGVDCRQLSYLVATEYIEYATKTYGIRDRRTNVSRVAVITGLTRKVVTDFRRIAVEGRTFRDIPDTVYSRFVNFIKENVPNIGRRKRVRVPARGNKDSFEDLATRFPGDLPVGALKAELRRIGVVNLDDTGAIVFENLDAVESVDEESFVDLKSLTKSIQRRVASMYGHEN